MRKKRKLSSFLQRLTKEDRQVEKSCWITKKVIKGGWTSVLACKKKLSSLLNFCSSLIVKMKNFLYDYDIHKGCSISSHINAAKLIQYFVRKFDSVYLGYQEYIFWARFSAIFFFVWATASFSFLSGRSNIHTYTKWRQAKYQFCILVYHSINFSVLFVLFTTVSMLTWISTRSLCSCSSSGYIGQSAFDRMLICINACQKRN